ncbi:hypothetical protein [Aquirufa echingensis]|uniref:PKD/Chitinase domain-containing protein n=1 Tax=Aquirufa echingensis TaxID=3096516 RepID=A0ABW6D099_9BACT
MKKHFTQLIAVFALTISGLFGFQNHVHAQGFTVSDPTLTESGDYTVIVWKVEQTTNNTGLSHFVIQNFCLPTGSNLTVENSADNVNWSTIPSTTADGSTQACQTFGSFLKFSGSSNAKINYYRATLKGKYILVDGQSILKFGNGQGRNNDESCIVVSTKVPKLASNIAETQIKQICEGGSINLQSASGFTNYVWKKDNASVSNNSNTYSITNAIPGTYQYQVTYQVSDCESFTEKFTVIVDAKPSISLSPASFCKGGSTNLSALITSEKKDGVWSIATGTGTISDGKLSSSTAGEVNLTYTISYGNGCTTSENVKVTVLALPTVVANASKSEVCDGNSVTLYGSGAATYFWSPFVTDNEAFKQNVGTVTYTVTGTDGKGCVNTATTNVTVLALPTVVANASKSEVCDGTSITLFGSGASTYSWSPVVTDNVAFKQNVGSVTYTVTGTDGKGCVNTATTSVTVLALPTVVANASKSEVCDGTSVTLYGSGASTYTWSPVVTDNEAFKQNVGTVIYTVTGTDNKGCTNTATKTIKVNELPTISLTSDLAICFGKSATLTAGGANSYLWSTTETNASISVSPETKTKYTVTGTDLNSCSASKDVEVTVNELPKVVANASETEVCDGTSVTLYGSGATSYTWDSLVSDNVAFKQNVGTVIYTVTGKDNLGCTNTATKTIKVNELPTISLTSDLAICIGNSTNLVASGANSYVWSTTETGAIISVKPETTTKYTVTGTDNHSCSASKDVEVTVNVLPIISLTSDLAICIGNSTNLTASGANSYVWSTTETGTTISVKPVTTTKYTVTGTDNHSCSASKDVEVTVNALPIISLTSDLAICIGNSTNLTASGANSYVWSTTETGAIISVKPETTTKYTVTGTDNHSCSASKDVEVTVNELPKVVANASATEVCDGTNVTLYGSGASSYTWSPVVTNNVAFKQNVGSVTYTVTGTDANSCQNSNSITIKVKALPTVSVSPDKSICVGETVTITASGDATSYLWTPGSQTSAEISVKPVTNTTYTVAGTLEGCTSNASTIITVKALPNILISGNNTVCAGETVSLTATGATSIVWSTGGQQGNLLSVSPTNTITYTATGTTDGCSASASFTVTVTDCAKFATYTQGYYGNVGGIACDGSTTKNKLLAAFSGVTSVTFGAAGGKSFTLYPTDITSDNIFKMLPGGGTPAALSPNKSIGWSYSKDYLGAKGSPLNSNGKITNNLLSQTITLWINKQTSTGLAGFRMPSSFVTAKLICPTSNINYSDTKEFKVASKLVNKTVGQLLDLANSALAGTLGSNDPSLSDIFTTVDMINNAFDQGRVVISSQTTNSVEIKTMSRVVQEQTETIQSVQAYPNPFKGTLTFTMTPRYTGQASLDVYNVSGMKVSTVFEGLLQAGEEQKIEFTIPEGQISQTFIFLFRQGNDVVQGKLVSL